MRTWTRRFAPAALLLGVSLLLHTGSVFAQARNADPVLGTWELNLTKSTFEGVPAPAKRTMVFTTAGEAIKHFTGTNPTGGGIANGTEYTAKYDSTDVHIAGSFLDTVALKRVDARTVERTGKVEGKVVETM